MKLKIFLSIIFILAAQNYVTAEEQPKNDILNTQTIKEKNKNLTDEERHKKIIEDYKQFLSTVSPNIRDEIREYRKAITQINKEKTALYKKLSQEAQNVIIKERKFKSQLPIRERKTMLQESQ